MKSFLLETIITLNLNRPFLSLGKEPFYLIQELLKKPEFEEKHFSVVIQSVEPICVLQNNNKTEKITVAFSSDRIFLKISYMDIPTQFQQFDSAISYVYKMLVALSDFSTLKWGIKGISAFGNFMLLDPTKETNAAQQIADGVLREGYLLNPGGMELKYNLQRNVPNKDWTFEDFIRIFKAKFDGYAAGKMNPENVGIQREIYFKISPEKYNNSVLPEFIDTVKP